MRIGNMFRAGFAALAMLAALPFAGHAQTVTQQPQFVAPRAVLDVGNGPTEFRMIQGSMAVFTSQSSGVGQTPGGALSTALTFTTTPTTLPCVGCIISGTGITSGTTSVTVVGNQSASIIALGNPMIVATGTTISWGAACPAAPPAVGLALVQASVGADLPFFTQARVCAYGGTGPGGQFTTFTIGAH